jgi:hypothetical protein
VFQLTDELTIASGVVASAEYRFMYRAQNFNGWGPLSEISYYIAATTPSTPIAPIYLSSDATSTTLQFVEPESTGGSPITEFKLYVDTITSVPNYQLVYQGSSNLHTVTVADDGLVTGVTYRYVLVASNVFGDSPQSEEIRVA